MERSKNQIKTVEFRIKYIRKIDFQKKNVLRETRPNLYYIRTQANKSIVTEVLTTQKSEGKWGEVVKGFYL